MQAEYEIIVILFSFVRRPGSEDCDRDDHPRFVRVQRRRKNRSLYADSRALWSGRVCHINVATMPPVDTPMNPTHSHVSCYCQSWFFKMYINLSHRRIQQLGALRRNCTVITNECGKWSISVAIQIPLMLFNCMMVSFDLLIIVANCLHIG